MECVSSLDAPVSDVASDCDDVSSYESDERDRFEAGRIMLLKWGSRVGSKSLVCGSSESHFVTEFSVGVDPESSDDCLGGRRSSSFAFPFPAEDLSGHGLIDSYVKL